MAQRYVSHKRQSQAVNERRSKRMSQIVSTVKLAKCGLEQHGTNLMIAEEVAVRVSGDYGPWLCQNSISIILPVDASEMTFFFVSRLWWARTMSNCACSLDVVGWQLWRQLSSPGTMCFMKASGAPLHSLLRLYVMELHLSENICLLINLTPEAWSPSKYHSGIQFLRHKEYLNLPPPSALYGLNRSALSESYR
jgi:hypothetical protein